VLRTLDLPRKLVEHGALWRPDSGRGLNDIRRTLYQCEPIITVELIEILKKHESCSEETIQELFRTPRMRQHLASHENKFQFSLKTETLRIGGILPEQVPPSSASKTQQVHLLRRNPLSRTWDTNPRPIREYEPEPQNNPNLTSHLTSHIM
jgi:hypothetical protein